ncbi:Hsp20/alpha crystallin family protein [Calditrichota bacterium]
MTLVRWQPYQRHNPWAGLSRLQRQMGEMFEQMADTDDGATSIMLTPRVEIAEKKDSYQISVELPGIDKQDVHVEVENNVLSISGEKHSGIEEQDQNFHLRERIYGKFSRSFDLPTRIEADKIEAKYSNGVLNLVIPKSEEAKPKQIEVKIN